MPLALGHESISQPKPLSSLSTQPFELTLVLGLFVDLFTDYFHMVWGFGVTSGKCFRPAPATREGVR